MLYKPWAGDDPTVKGVVSKTRVVDNAITVGIVFHRERHHRLRKLKRVFNDNLGISNYC